MDTRVIILLRATGNITQNPESIHGQNPSAFAKGIIRQRWA